MIIRLIDLILEDSEAAKQAKSQGLTSMGFGRWGKDGVVTHTTKKGKLVPIKSAPNKSQGEPDTPQQPEKLGSRTDQYLGWDKSIRPQGSAVDLISTPTKQNPSFDELRKEARKHQYTVMTKAPLKPIRSVNPVDKEINSVGKPVGFWFGVGEEWIDWTEQEMPEWKGDNLYAVEVDESQCLVIEDELGLREFNRTYGTRDGMIDWERVAKDHKGIIFKEYFPQYRMKYRWYYSWDVASGCIWDTSAIKQVEQQPIGTDEAKPVPFEKFKETLPKFTEKDEAIADEDEESGKASMYGSDNWEEVIDTVEKWKWGGDEGKGAWGFEASEREKMFDIINKHIRDTKATVQAPKLYRGIAFENSEAAQRFIAQFKPGQSVELPPCGWSPDTAVSMEYGPNNSLQPEISAIIELEAGDSPIQGLATTAVERNMGMEIIQHEVITPGDIKYEVKEITQHTVTKDGRTQIIHKIVLKQVGYTNENTASKIKKYTLLAYMGGNMAMADNIRTAYKNIRKNK